MDKDEKIAFLCQVAGVQFCADCDGPIYLHNYNVPYYSDGENYQCAKCASK